MYHSSSSENFEPHSNGLFGEFVCFTNPPYCPGQMETIWEAVDVDIDVDTIECCQLYSYANEHGLIETLLRFEKEIMNLVPCDQDTAEELLTQETDLGYLEDFDFPNEFEKDFEIQRIRAAAAKALGFKGVEQEDEQGCVYFIDVTQTKLKQVTMEDI